VTAEASPFESQCRRFLTGLVGRDILASRSPWLHEREADAQGLRLVYSLYDFAVRRWDEADLPGFLAAAETVGFVGLNVTYPYKQAVIPLLDELSEGARRVGAVNTVHFAEGRRVGYNTDVLGFGESMKHGLPHARLDKIVQVGAGGAGYATAHALLDMGAERLILFDTDAERREMLVAKLARDFGAGRASAGTDIGEALSGATGLVNATPMGMAKFPGTAIPIDFLHPGLWVADIVYFPLETALLREARRRGCATLDGSGMVVYQAAAAFEIFTGVAANRGRMLNSFVESVTGANARAA
jgi:shikimate dehydrogenase